MTEEIEKRLFSELTDSDRKFISQIMSDFTTGDHLKRGRKGWEQMGIDYDAFVKWRNNDWYSVVKNVGLTSDKSTIKEKQMWIYAKCCVDKEFAYLIGLIDKKPDENVNIYKLHSERIIDKSKIIPNDN